MVGAPLPPSCRGSPTRRPMYDHVWLLLCCHAALVQVTRAREPQVMLGSAFLQKALRGSHTDHVL